jgi:hypothetical protein
VLWAYAHPIAKDTIHNRDERNQSRKVIYQVLDTDADKAALRDTVRTATADDIVTFSNSHGRVAVGDILWGTVVELKHVGDVLITAMTEVDSVYRVAFQERTLTIVKSPQTIDFAPIGTLTVGDVRKLVATATSGATSTGAVTTANPDGLKIRFELNRSDFAQISHDTVFALSPGTVSITAIQDGDDNWYEARQTQYDIKVLPIDSALLLAIEGGTLYPPFSSHIKTGYTLSLSCNETRLLLRYDNRDRVVVLNEDGTSLTNDSVVVIEEAPSYREIHITLTSIAHPDRSNAYTLKLQAPFGKEFLYWDSVNFPNKLEVINRPDVVSNMLGREFRRYEWYVDGDTAPASTRGIYYNSGGIGGHTYRVRVSYDDEGDNWVEICPLDQPVVKEYSKLSVYPNPAGAEVTVRYTSISANDNAEILIYHLSTGAQAAIYPTGKEVAGENHIMLDVSALPAGAYLVKRGDEAVVMVKK